MMAKRKMSLNELSEKVDLTLSNLSILKTGKAKAIRFSTLEAICKALNCQPSDLLEYVEAEKEFPLFFLNQNSPSRNLRNFAFYSESFPENY